MTERNEIRLFVHHGHWYGRFVGPHAGEVITLFGTDTVPTPFDGGMPASAVCRDVAGLNPGVFVSVGKEA